MSAINFWDRPACPRQPVMADVLPNGASRGDLVIRHEAFTERDALYQGLAIAKGRGRRGTNRVGDIHARIYQRSVRCLSGPDGMLWMSDAANERCDHADALREARGDVLVGGLGLGLFALSAMIKPEVNSVTVVELNRDVIDLVTPHIVNAASRIAPAAALCSVAGEPLRAAPLEVVNADLMKWKPPKGVKWDAIWFDIWPTLCTDDLEEHATLARRFARRKNPGASFGCWGNGFLKSMRWRHG